jgi:hypothetical protein
MTPEIRVTSTSANKGRTAAQFEPLYYFPQQPAIRKIIRELRFSRAIASDWLRFFQNFPIVIWWEKSAVATSVTRLKFSVSVFFSWSTRFYYHYDHGLAKV